MNKTVTWLSLAFCVATFLFPGTIYGEDPAGSLGTGVSEIDTDASYHALNVRFMKNGQGVVVDAETCLEWFVGPDRDTTWNQAKAWVENLEADGGNWRMPTRKELRSLFIKGAGWCNMSPLFRTRGHYIWANEKVGSQHAWGFCFNNGNDFWPRCTYSQAARVFAVRPAKTE